MLARFKGKPTKESIEESSKFIAKAVEEGVKFLGAYWTLGRYAVNEKD